MSGVNLNHFSSVKGWLLKSKVLVPSCQVGRQLQWKQVGVYNCWRLHSLMCLGRCSMCCCVFVEIATSGWHPQVYLFAYSVSVCVALITVSESFIGLLERQMPSDGNIVRKVAYLHDKCQWWFLNERAAPCIEHVGRASGYHLSNWPNTLLAVACNLAWQNTSTISCVCLHPGHPCTPMSQKDRRLDPLH